MGDWYDFDIQIVDGKEVPSFSYQSKSTNYEQVTVQLSASQYELASAYHKKLAILEKEKDTLIKSFLGL